MAGPADRLREPTSTPSRRRPLGKRSRAPPAEPMYIYIYIYIYIYMFLGI
jgi:hypothetical protein